MNKCAHKDGNAVLVVGGNFCSRRVLWCSRCGAIELCEPTMNVVETHKPGVWIRARSREAIKISRQSGKLEYEPEKGE